MELLTQTTTQLPFNAPFLNVLTFHPDRSCEKPNGFGISWVKNGARVIHLANKNTATIVLAATLFAIPFNTLAQNSNDAIVLNTQKSEVPITEDEKSTTEKTPAATIKDGHAANAQGASSRRDIVAIWLYTEGVDDKGYDVKGYAIELKKLFDNSGIYPGAPVEFYCSGGNKGISPRAAVYINGRIYNLKTGELQPSGGLFHPFSVGHRVQDIIQKWAKENGVVLSATTTQSD